MKFSVLITTYNRAEHLRQTLESLARVSSRLPWEAIIVDNNSHDGTRGVVSAAQTTFPVPLTYLFEPTQGKPAALNAGIRRARGEFVVMTDDDVALASDWLDSCAQAFEQFDCDYVGGRVLPMWEQDPPRWFRNRRGRQWAVVALLDYGAVPVEMGRDGIGWPLGANMAVRRDAFDKVGWWDNRFGRQGSTLRG
jgi:glycosyltransferase involved in cell wall biosynthesis